MAITVLMEPRLFVLALLQLGVYEYIHRSLAEMLQHIEHAEGEDAEDPADYLSYKVDYILNIAAQTSLLFDLPDDLLCQLDGIRQAVAVQAEKKQHSTNWRGLLHKLW